MEKNTVPKEVSEFMRQNAIKSHATSLKRYGSKEAYRKAMQERGKLGGRPKKVIQ